MSDSGGTNEYRPVTVEGKTAVVIGGTSGIGRAIAIGFAKDGADVVATSRSESRVGDTAETLRAEGADTVEVTCDVIARETLESVRETVDAELGGTDVLVNSPSSIARSDIADATDAEWDAVFDVQLDGTRRATQVFAPEMEDGSIINVASLSAELAMPELAAYSTAKGGLGAFTRVAAQEFAPEVRVNAVRPGFIESKQTEGVYAEGMPRHDRIAERTAAGRLGHPEEIIGAAIYLASDAASYTTGEILTVDSGFTANTFVWD
ncbi:SDR family NAD(P)-dependent oxidoreductase [Haladaptatus sp. CMAA 1911]|uniref:SDR family NAD(P)-dependent oxidoreductase n=1 Tax=unclassified Haladaptatus TaxID=2622732 RepID=UPI00375456C6